MFRLKFILWSLVIVGLGVVIALLGYVLINPSHHTAWNPYTVYIVLVPLFVFGLILAILNRMNRSQFVPAILLSIISLTGIILVLLLDKMNRLLQYEEWVRRGMP